MEYLCSMGTEGSGPVRGVGMCWSHDSESLFSVFTGATDDKVTLTLTLITIFTRFIVENAMLRKPNTRPIPNHDWMTR